jgi:hypothetical protein
MTLSPPPPPPPAVYELIDQLNALQFEHVTAAEEQNTKFYDAQFFKVSDPIVLAPAQSVVVHFSDRFSNLWDVVQINRLAPLEPVELGLLLYNSHPEQSVHITHATDLQTIVQNGVLVSFFIVMPHGYGRNPFVPRLPVNNLEDVILWHNIKAKDIKPALL